MLSNALVEEVYERARRRGGERRGEDGWSDRIYSFMEGPQALVRLYGAEHEVKCIVGRATQVERDVAVRECATDPEYDWRVREDRDREARKEDRRKRERYQIRSSAGVVQDVVRRSAMQFFFRRKGGGWARIAAGMVGGGKEEANGAATDSSFERYTV
ncbi:hypothetical protein B0H14DRAFT_3135345 [Mycena olivaceomarginata]|nr:hypothetical protein B0H14DRAFT_3135345 [Mycena olivaceomarginata]